MSTRSPTRLTLFLMGLCAVAVLAWWLWPRHDRLAEGPPRHADVLEVPPPEPSRLVIPVTVPLDDLAATVEARVPEEVLTVEGDPLSAGWSADLAITRPGPVVAFGEEQRLRIDIPLRLNARAFRAKRAERRADKGKATQGIGVDFDAVLELGTALSIDDRWSLSSVTELDVRWIEPPAVQLGPLRLPIRKPVEKKLREQLAEVASGIDERLAEQDATRVAIERVWSELSAPRQLSEQPQAWLITTPTALSMSDLQVHDDHLELRVGYVGTVQTVLGPQPAASEPTPLPDRTEPSTELGYRIVLPVVLGWEDLSVQATAAVAGQTWTLPGADSQTASLELVDLELYPSGDLVALRADYRASHPGWQTDGTVFFTGRPTVDPVARTVSLEDFAYVLDTWDTSVWSANALVQSGVEEAVAERLVFPYGERLDDVVAEADGKLAAGSTTDRGATTTGSVDRIDLLSAGITEDALVVVVRAEGTLAVQAKPEDAPADLDLERPDRPR